MHGQMTLFSHVMILLAPSFLITDFRKQSISAGAVCWGPCKEALEEALKDAHEPEVYSYNFDHGMNELREALRQKIRNQNKLDGVCSSHN